MDAEKCACSHLEVVVAMSRHLDNELCPTCKAFVSTMAGKPLNKLSDILACLEHFRDKKQEYFICLSVDSGQRLIARRVVTIGLLDTALAHPREVFAGPLEDRAASVIIAHNHPSGEASPSREDIKTTQQHVAAGILLGVPLRDHLIVTHNEYYSFKEHGLIM
jgi:DNA repair protein RadC